MVPFRLDADWLQVRVNVPLKGPLYVPDQPPERSTAAGAGVGVAIAVGIGVGVDVGGAACVVEGVGVSVVVDALHAQSRTAVKPTIPTSVDLNITSLLLRWLFAGPGRQMPRGNTRRITTRVMDIHDQNSDLFDRWRVIRCRRR